jgi:hypothetical protein
MRIADSIERNGLDVQMASRHVSRQSSAAFAKNRGDCRLPFDVGTGGRRSGPKHRQQRVRDNPRPPDHDWGGDRLRAPASSCRQVVRKGIVPNRRVRPTRGAMCPDEPPPRQIKPNSSHSAYLHTDPAEWIAGARRLNRSDRQTTPPHA